MRLIRIRLWWQQSFWAIPLVSIVGAVVLVDVAAVVDEELFAASGGVSREVSPEAATTLLAAIGGGMVTFTGLVFSFVLLLMQFGSSQYSPRTVTFFLHMRTPQVVLALFLTTALFGFASVLGVGSAGRAEFTPEGSVSIAGLLLIASLVGFVSLLRVIGIRVRVDNVLAALGSATRSGLLRNSRQRVRRGEVPQIAPDRTKGTPVRYTGSTGMVVAINVGALVRLSRRHGANIVLLVEEGDSVSAGSVIARVVARRPVSDSALSRCLLVRAERILNFDELYGLRLIVDIAIRALSPAINDPTTAVRAIVEVEGILRVAAELPMGPHVIAVGEHKVVLRDPTWDEVVDMALTEIVASGAKQPQVTRRVAALLDELYQDVSADRRPALRRHLESLSLLVESQVAAVSRVSALRPDRQGIGAPVPVREPDDSRG